MQFHVPQFIDVEDKIFGPLSAKQFFYLAGAAGAFFIFFSLTESIFLGLILSSPIIALGLALAFYRINNRPFINIIEAAFKYITKPRLFIWKKIPKKIIPGTTTENDVGDLDIFVPKLSDSKLKDLAWSLDIQESIHSNSNR